MFELLSVSTFQANAFQLNKTSNTNIVTAKKSGEKQERTRGEKRRVIENKRTRHRVRGKNRYGVAISSQQQSNSTKKEKV